MIQELRFVRMNTDVAGHDMKPEEGEYRMMENLAPPQRGRGQGFVRESLYGTEEIAIDLQDGINYKCIGTYEDAPNNRMFFFLYEYPDVGTRKDKIYMYNGKTNAVEKVLDTEFLGWTEDLKITGISLLDDVLYWTDYELKYFRLQDNTQLIEINYYAREISDSSTNDYRFIATSVDGTVDVNVVASVTGPKTASELLTEVADLFNADPAFSAHFTATKVSNSEVIKITAISKTGNWLLPTNSTVVYYYYATNYDPVIESERDLTMYPLGPTQVPEITPSYDSSIPFNNIGVQNWQFAYRYIYTNNQISVFSPYSEFHPSARFPEDRVSSNQINKLTILLPVRGYALDKIKSVEIAARVSQTGDFFIVKAFKRHELFTNEVGIDRGLFYEFKGTEVQEPIATADVIKQQEGQPLQSVDLQLQKNKLFVIDNLTGFDVDPGDFEMQVEIEENVYLPDKRWLKDSGRYIFGIRFFDSYMRTDGTVHKPTEVDTGDGGYGGTGKLSNQRKRAAITLEGRPPVWAQYYSIVRSDELFYSNHIQAKFYIHYWVRPMDEAETYADFASDTVYYAMWGQVYLRPDQDQNNVVLWKYIHLQQPTNLPYVVQRGMIIDGNANFTPARYLSILDVVGPMIVIDKPPGTTIFIDSLSTIWLQIFTDRQTAVDNSFYEVGPVYFVYNAGESNRSFHFFPNTVITQYGDCFYENNEMGVDGTPDDLLNWKYDFEEYTTSGSDDDDKGIQESRYQFGYYESYSPSYRATQVQVVEQEEDTPLGNIGGNLGTTEGGTYTESGYDFGYMPSSEYETRNLGRPAVLLQNTRQEERPSTLRWSNDYVANASINGLHTFEPLNEYPLPLERGPVIKLQNAGTDVMLAIHSSAVTSMYIGKGIIRSADLDPTLVTTDSVIGTDSQLKYSFGTVHPESVCEVDGNVYFWDGTRNEPVRYSQNGLTPMATTFGTRVFFKDTIPATFGNSESYTCNTEYDRLLNMVFFTFSNGTTSLTIGFHETSKAWIGKYGFTPEIYGVVGDQLIGFVGGVPWLHNADVVNHNTFYGTLYPSRATFILNQGGHLEKAWDSMMVDSKHKWDCPMIYNNENQVTSLLAEDFVWRDQVYYADFLRDLNTDPQLLAIGQIALRHGNFLSSQVLTVEMELESSEAHYLHAIAVASTVKPGHMVQQ